MTFSLILRTSARTYGFHMNFVVIAVILLVLAFGLGSILTFFADQRIKKSRAGISVDSFREEFDSIEIKNNEAIEIAYEDLVSLVGYPVTRGDRIDKDLCVLNDDFEIMLEERLSKMGLLTIEEANILELFPIRTVGEYVVLIDKILDHSEVIKEHVCRFSNET